MTTHYILDDNNNILPITASMQKFIDDLQDHITVVPEAITSKYCYNGIISDPNLMKQIIKCKKNIKCSFHVWNNCEWIYYNDAT